MKKIFLVLGLLITTCAIYAQFPTIDSLRKFNNKYIRNQAIDAFTNLRLNAVNNGIINFLDSAYRVSPANKIDSAVLVQDSIIVNYKSGAIISRDTIRVLGRTSLPNTSVGGAYRLAISGTNNVKTIAPGLYMFIDSSATNRLTLVLDTANFVSYLKSRYNLGSTSGGSTDTTALSNRVSTINNNKVDSAYRLNDSTIRQKINGRITDIVIKGTPGKIIVDTVNGLRINLTGDTLSLAYNGGGGPGAATVFYPTLSAMLAAARPLDSTVVQISNYYSQTDNVRVDYQWFAGSTTTADNMTVFGTGTGRYKIVIRNNTVDLKQLGQFGGVKVDATAGINAAMVWTAARGIVLHRPSNTVYLINSGTGGGSIGLTLVNNLKLKADDSTAVIKAAVYSGHNASQVGYYSSTTPLTNVLIDGGTFDGGQKFIRGAFASGNAIADTNSHIIYISKGSNITIRNIHLQNGGTYCGIFAYDVQGMTYQNNISDSIGGKIYSTIYCQTNSNFDLSHNINRRAPMRKRWNALQSAWQNSDDVWELGGTHMFVNNNEAFYPDGGRWFVIEKRGFGYNEYKNNIVHGFGKNTGGISWGNELTVPDKIMVNNQIVNNVYDSMGHDTHTTADTTNGVEDYYAGNFNEIGAGSDGLNFSYNIIPYSHFTISRYTNNANIAYNVIASPDAHTGTEAGIGIIFNVATCCSGDTISNINIHDNIISSNDNLELFKFTAGQARIRGFNFYNNTINSSKNNGLIIGEMYQAASNVNPFEVHVNNNTINGTVYSAFYNQSNTTPIQLDFSGNKLANSNIDTASNINTDFGTQKMVINKVGSLFQWGIYGKGDSLRNNSGVLEHLVNGLWKPQFTLPVGGSTNLGTGTRTTTTYPVTSSSGTSVSIQSATNSLAGLMSAADKLHSDSNNIGKVYTTSGTGMVDDADLSFGSSTFGTNNTVKWQALLDKAQYGPITIYVDGHYSLDSMKVRGGTHIICNPGCGFIKRDNSNGFLFSTYNTTNNAINNVNITIDGGIWNANGFRGGVEKQIRSDAFHGMTAGFYIVGSKNLTIRDATLLNSRTFMLLGMWNENALLDHITIDQGSTADLNQDGFDFIGYLNGFTIQNSTITTGDDRMAFSPNPASGFAYGEHHEPYAGCDGDQTNISIRNIFFKGNGKGIALYSSANKIDGVKVDGVYGEAHAVWLLVRNFGTLTGYTYLPGVGHFNDLVFQNINVRILQDYAYDGSNVIGEADLGSNIDDITFRNIRRDTLYPHSIPSIIVHNNGGSAITINNMTVDGYKSTENGSNTNFPHILISEGSVGTLSLLNNRYIKTTSLTGSQFIKVASGATVYNLKNSSDLIYGVDNYLNNLGTVGKINSSGLMHLNSSIASFKTSSTISGIVLSNYLGSVPINGTFTSSTGDAFGSGGSSSQFTTVANGINYAGRNIGIHQATPTHALDIDGAGEADTSGVFISNSNTGTLGGANVTLKNNSGQIALFQLGGSGKTPYGVFKANGFNLYNGGVGGINLSADNASGAISFATGGTPATERFNIGANGSMKMFGTPMPSSAPLYALGKLADSSIVQYAWPAGGTTSPSGSNTWLQYNNSGAFGASDALTFDNSAGNLAISKNQNAITQLSISNSTAGISSQARAAFLSDVNQLYFGVRSSTTTTAGTFIPNAAYFLSPSGNLAFAATGTGSNITFETGSSFPSTNRMQIDNNGTIHLGTSSTSGQVWTATGTDGSGAWAIPTSGADPTTTAGDIIYRSSGGSLTRLGIGTARQTLHVVSGVPAWIDTAATGNAPQIAYQNYGGGYTATTSLTSFTTPAATGVYYRYEILNHLNITAISSATISSSVSYTDETGTSRTIFFYNGGSLSTTMNAVGASDYASKGEILCAPNTAINFNYTISGTSATYNWSHTLISLGTIAP